MLLSELYKIMVKKVTFVGFRVAIAPNARWIRLSHFDEFEARTLIWKPNARANEMFRYDCGEGFYLKGR